MLLTPGLTVISMGLSEIDWTTIRSVVPVRTPNPSVDMVYACGSCLAAHQYLPLPGDDWQTAALGAR